MPRMDTGPGGAVGRAITRRRNVVGEAWMPKWPESRAPNSPQVATPSAWSICESRVVMRAQGWTKTGTRSVKILRGQVGVSQKNLRICKTSCTWKPPYGTSATTRV
jgi:hypothetical protein